MTEYSRTELYNSIVVEDDIFVSEQLRNLVKINYEIFSRAEDTINNGLKYNQILEYIENYKREHRENVGAHLRYNYFELKMGRNDSLENRIRQS